MDDQNNRISMILDHNTRDEEESSREELARPIRNPLSLARVDGNLRSVVMITCSPPLPRNLTAACSLAWTISELKVFPVRIVFNFLPGQMALLLDTKPGQEKLFIFFNDHQHNFCLKLVGQYAGHLIGINHGLYPFQKTFLSPNNGDATTTGRDNNGAGLHKLLDILNFHDLKGRRSGYSPSISQARFLNNMPAPGLTMLFSFVSIKPWADGLGWLVKQRIT